MAKEIINTVFAIGDKIAEEQGVYLVDAEYKKEGKDWYLRLFIDKAGGVGIDECEAFSRAFGEEMDRIDPIAEAYCLEISSPGVDRKLKTEREFTYYIGRRVEVKLYKALDGKKEFDGVLEDYRDNLAYIRVDDAVVGVNPKEAVYIRLYFTF